MRVSPFGLTSVVAESRNSRVQLCESGYHLLASFTDNRAFIEFMDTSSQYSMQRLTHDIDCRDG